MTGRRWFGPVLLVLLLLFGATTLERRALGGSARQDNPPAEQPRLINIRGERLIGLPIINREGERIGGVGDVLVSVVGQRQSGNAGDPARGGRIASGRVDYVIGQYGGVLGWDRASVPLPLAALRLHLVDGADLGVDDDVLYFEGTDPGDEVRQARKDFFDQNALVLVGAENLDNVPKAEMDRLDDVAAPNWDASLRAYWQGLGTQWPQDTAENGAAYRVNSVRDLRRFSLRELGGDGLGWIEDTLVTLSVANPLLAPIPARLHNAGADTEDDAEDDADTDRRVSAAQALAASLPVVDARVHYLLVGHGGWWGLGARTTPVPFNSLMMDRDYDERNLYLEGDENLMNDAPALDRENGEGDLNDGNFFTRVHSYWEEAGFGPAG